MGGHIRFDKDIPEDARTLALADAIADHLWGLIENNALPKSREELCNALGWLLRNAALGSVARLWVHGDTHVSGDNTLDVSLEMLSDVTHIPAWLLRRYSSKWLRVTSDGRVELPEYTEKNTLISREKRREQSRLRVARWRAKQKHSGNALHKKKRNTRNGVRTQGSRASARARARAGASRVTGTGTETTETGTGIVGGAALAAGEDAAAPRKSLSEELRDRFGIQQSPVNGHATVAAASAPEELEAKARKLAAGGLDVPTIVTSLARYGVTHEQVTAWLSNEGASA